jgi:hypothetical protein
MGARDKLNGVVVVACLIVAALLGAAMESWLAFWAVLILSVAGCSDAGGIRTRPGAGPSGARRGGGGGRHPTRGR